jgi:phosphate transport system permease protein
VIGTRTHAAETVETACRRSLRWSSSRSADRLFEGIAAAFAGFIIFVVALIAWELWTGSRLAREAFGFGFFTSGAWDPVNEVYGAAPYIFGTVVTSLVALVLAAPLGIGASIFLVELAPKWLRAPVGFLVEMLAAIPSVIYGLWAIFVLVPIVRSDIEPFLGKHLGFIPLFDGRPYGVGILSASLVLAIMVLPTVTAITQSVLATVPRNIRDGAYGLGATRWEVITGVTLPYARGGIIGALILGLGRALGETMAVTMVIGNNAQVSWSLFGLGDSLASVIANQFAEAQSKLFRSTLIELGLILFGVSVALNLIARLIVARMPNPAGSGRRG